MYNSAAAQEHQEPLSFLLFWKSDCEACHVAIPQIVKKIDVLDNTKFSITAISFDTDSINYYKEIKALNMKNFINKYDFKSGYIGNPWAKKYNITKTPTLLWIDKNGNVLAEGNEAFKKLCTLKK